MVPHSVWRSAFLATSYCAPADWNMNFCEICGLRIPGVCVVNELLFKSVVCTDISMLISFLENLLCKWKMTKYKATGDWQVEYIPLINFFSLHLISFKIIWIMNTRFFIGKCSTLNHPNKAVVFFQNALFTISWWHHLTTLQVESIITLNSQLSKICLYRLQCELIDGFYGYEFMSLMNIEWT